MGYRYIGTSIVKAPSPALKVIVFIDHKNSHYKSTELGVYGLVELKLCCLYRQAILKMASQETIPIFYDCSPLLPTRQKYSRLRYPLQKFSSLFQSEKYNIGRLKVYFCCKQVAMTLNLPLLYFSDQKSTVMSAQIKTDHQTFDMY